MSDLRDVGGVPSARFDDAQILLREFVKIVFPSGPGTIRYTNIVGGFVGDIDGASETWTEYAGLTVGPIPQGKNSALDVSWVQFADADENNLWVGYLKTPGVREVPCTIYRAHFNLATGALYNDAYVIYEGDMDEGRDLGSAVRIVLVPSAERAQIPGRSFLPHMDEFLLMPKPGDTITIGTTTIDIPAAPRASGYGATPVRPYVDIAGFLP